MKRADPCVGTDAPFREWVLSGPSIAAVPGHMPVRGDLAHIRLAGMHFVPHYAVPMPHRVKSAGATLRAAPQSDADMLARLESGARFAVLDIAGNWAWGQVETENEVDDGSGPVGYVILEELERITP